MAKAPAFLKGQKEEEVQDLDKLHKMAVRYLELEKEINELTEKIKEAKSTLNTYSQELIPQFLLSNGLSEIRLETGEKITIKEDISITIKDDNAFFKFLRERKEDDIIKTFFQFDRMKPDKLNALFTFLDNEEYEFEAKKDVHAQTKKKYFKGLLGMGQDKEDYEEGLKGGEYVKKEAIDRFVKIFNYYITKIK